MDPADLRWHLPGQRRDGQEHGLPEADRRHARPQHGREARAGEGVA
jgi:hypothetical protein